MVSLAVPCLSQARTSKRMEGIPSLDMSAMHADQVGMVADMGLECNGSHYATRPAGFSALGRTHTIRVDIVYFVRS